MSNKEAIKIHRKAFADVHRLCPRLFPSILLYRMAALEILYGEEVPVILDDAFGCYDEKRLKYTLKWLSEQSRQVIIFSCQKRELEILNEIEMERQGRP